MASLSYHTQSRRACLLLLFASLLPAQPRRAMFWTASSPDNVVYLLGSMHIGDKSMYPLPKEIEDAFDRSAVVAVEIDINQIDIPQLQLEMAKLGSYPQGDNLWNHIRPETRQALEQFCAGQGVPPERFASMKPWIVSMNTATMPMLKGGLDLNLAIDKYFMDKAKDKKRIVSIESAGEQFKLFASFPDDVQEQILLDGLRKSGKDEDQAKRMVDTWNSGDAAALDHLAAEMATGPPEVRRATREDRNPRMADAAEQLLKSKEIGFVMVGAAHMVGKEGILAILASRGYKIEQVPLKP